MGVPLQLAVASFLQPLQAYMTLCLAVIPMGHMEAQQQLQQP
jgi:hypothetical protein